MAESPLPWLRLYNETASDPKFEVIAENLNLHHLLVLGAWCKLLCIAGSSPVRGQLNVTLHKRYSNVTVTAMLRLSNDQCNALLDQFVEYEMLVRYDDGGYGIRNWDKRQFESDNSKSRVKKYREKTTEQPCNVTRPLQDRYSNGDVTPPDTDTDTDTDTDVRAYVRHSDDKFDQIQRWLETNTGFPASGADDVNTIQELVTLDIIEDDIKSAISWLNGSAGKTCRRFSSLLNPIKVAYGRRVQEANGNGNGCRKRDAFEPPPIPESRIRVVNGKKEYLDDRYKTWEEADAHMARWLAELEENDRLKELEAENERLQQ